MGFYDSGSPVAPKFNLVDAQAPDLGSGVSGGDPGMDAVLAARKKKPQWQSFLEGLGQNMAASNGGGGGISSNFSGGGGQDLSAPGGAPYPEHKGAGFLGAFNFGKNLMGK